MQQIKGEKTFRTPETPALEVFVVDTNSFGAISPSILATLEKKEIQKGSQFPQGSERKRYLLSRILLRRALSRLLGGNPEGWRFVTEKSGKARLSEPPGGVPVDFSRSLSESAVALGVSARCHIGIHLEHMNSGIFESSGGINPLRSFFTARELISLKKKPMRAVEHEALRIWNIKEAYAKLLGRGTDIDFSELDVLLDQRRIIHMNKGVDQAMRVSFETREFYLNSKLYHLAIAASPDEADLPDARVYLTYAPFWSDQGVEPASGSGDSSLITRGLTRVPLGSASFSPNLRDALPL